MATLTLKNLSKIFADNVVLDKLDLSINEGEFIVIVGASGCGKSTLLRLIAGLETASTGDIYIDAQNINHLPPKDRNIAMVFQNYALYPHMTVFKNMAYGLQMRRYKKADIVKRVQIAAELLDLVDLLQRKPNELSGGQRQRVAMGRAIVREPALFLFDEPLSNLDAKLRVQMRLQIKALQQKLGVTSVYVTHDQVEAMTMADRLVVLNQGKVEQIGQPLDVYNRPNSVFVAGFLGSPAMNFMPGELNNEGSAVKLTEQITLPLGNKALKNHTQKAVTVGIRPESIFAKEKQGADWFELNIEMIEPLGSDTLVYGYLPDGQQCLTARLSKKWQANVGDKVALAVMPDSLHIFDAHTEERLT